MSYDNVDDLAEYFSATMDALKAIESIPYPETELVLDNTTLWGVKKSLDELRIQIMLLQRNLIDFKIEMEN